MIFADYTPSVARLMLDEAAACDLQRQVRMQNAWKAYYGQSKKPLKVAKQPDGTEFDDNIILANPRLIVDHGVSFLFGQELHFDVEGAKAAAQAAKDADEEPQESPADTWLDACWNQNRRMTTLIRTALNGGVCGHAFLRVFERTPYPRLLVVDPANVTVESDPQDWETITRYTITTHGVDPATGKAMAYRQLIEPSGTGWSITDQVSREDSGRWETVQTTPWRWSFPPIFSCQNLPEPNGYWGLSDIEDDVLEASRSINFVLSNLARIIRFHAHPKTWARGMGQTKLDLPVNGITFLTNPQAELRNLEMASDLGSSLELYGRLKEALHEISRIPEVAAGKLNNVGPLSGVALRILYGPIAEKTGTKRLLYGEMLANLNAALLEMGGFGAGLQVEAHWQNTIPTDEYNSAQTGLLWEQLGVSEETTLERLGFDAAGEARKRGKEAERKAAAGAALLEAYDNGAGPGLPAGGDGPPAPEA